MKNRYLNTDKNVEDVALAVAKAYEVLGKTLPNNPNDQEVQEMMTKQLHGKGPLADAYHQLIELNHPESQKLADLAILMETGLANRMGRGTAPSEAYAEQLAELQDYRMRAVKAMLLES